jgi:hypothetical protein
MSSLFTAIQAADTSSSQVPTSEIKDLILVIALVVGIISVLVWLWIAWKNRAGRNWARVPPYTPYAPPGYAPPGYAPPGSSQWQPYGQPPAAPQDPQAPPRPPLA